jgi:hypothetical protein
VAEDFVAAFDVGNIRVEDGKRDDHYLAAGDVAGVALIGVQELYRITEELREKTDKIEQLEIRLAELQTMVDIIWAQQKPDENQKVKLAQNNPKK